MATAYRLMMDTLSSWDNQLFRWINQQHTSPWMDVVSPWIRESTHWIPLYVALLGIAWWKFKSNGVIWFVFGLLAVTLSDLIGNYGFKHVFERLRPCNDPALVQSGLRLLVDTCGSGYSFVSNHAANHMSLAIFFWTTLHHRIGPWGWLGVAWALSIAYAQVYVGLHFPFDIVAGALLGVGIGWAVGWSFNRQFKNAIFPVKQSTT